MTKFGAPVDVTRLRRQGARPLRPGLAFVTADGVRAEVGDKKDVHDAEERLHSHLQDHGHGQEDDRAVNRDGSKVLPRAAYSFFDQGKQIRNSRLQGILSKGTQASLHRALPA